MSESEYKPDKTPGVFAWNEIVTRNKEDSMGFYAKLFGWTTDTMEMPGGATYTMFKQGERPVAGCVEPPPDAAEAPEMWLSYINVEDLDAAVSKAKDLGAKICKERVDLPIGSFAIVNDPNGATFALWQPGEDCPS